MSNPSTPSPFRPDAPPVPAVPRVPQQPPDFRLAQERHKAGRLAEAEAGYRQWLSLHPADAAALHMLGLVHHQAGQQHEALALLRQAVRTAGNAAGVTATASDAYGPDGPVEGPSVTYDQDGQTIIATTEDADAAAFAQSLTVDVASNVTLTATAGGPVDQGDAASLVIDYCDPQGFSADTLVVDWDDGSSDQSVAAASVVDLSHVYAHGGTTYNVTVAADSVAGPVDAGPVPIYVDGPGATNDPHEQISIDADTGVAAGSPLGISFTAVGAFMSYCGCGVEDYPVGSAYTIDWGDSSTGSAGGTQPSDSEFDGAGSHTYAHDGQYLVTVTDESDGASASEFVIVAAPTLTIATIPDQAVDEGSSLTFSATLSGAEAGDYSQAYVNWNNGRGNLPATISGNTITAYKPVVGANVTLATVTVAVGATVAATQQANVRVTPIPVGWLTVTDVANNANWETVTNSTPGNLYIPREPSGSVSISATFSATLGPQDADRVRLAVGPARTTPKVTWSGPSSARVATVTPTAGRSDFTIELKVDHVVVRSIDVHLFTISLNSVTFDGPNDVPVKMNATTPASGPQWVTGTVDEPDTTTYAAGQALPAAFVEGKALQADVSFTLGGSYAGVTSVSIDAPTADDGPYAGFGPATINISNGRGTATFTSEATDNTVDLNDITFDWDLLSFSTASQQGIQHEQSIQATTNRIYTLLAKPPNPSPMSTPWAGVLELATGMAKGLSDPTDIMSTLTTGMYYSSWTAFAGSSHFINPVTKMIYVPSAAHEFMVGPAGSKQSGYSVQNYNLRQFLDTIGKPGPGEKQDCADNADLLSLLAASLGITAAPVYIAKDANQTAPLAITSYYIPAGTSTATRDIFAFHQVVQYDGVIYDPSTAANNGGTPDLEDHEGLDLAEYVNEVFPGNGSYVSNAVGVANVF